MNVLSVCGAAVLLSVIGYALREFGYRGAPLFAVLCGVCLLTAGLAPVRQMLPLAEVLLGNETVRDAASVALRIVGIGYVCMICTDICRDLGEGGIARTVVLVCRICVLALALPYIEKIWRIGASLLI